MQIRVDCTKPYPSFNGEYTARPQTLQSIKDYVERGWQPGGFVTAVLENDLAGAIARADADNLRNLPAIVAFVYAEVPAICWGSPAKVAAHLRNPTHQGE